MKRFEEGLHLKVEYRLSKPLDTVSALEIGLPSDGSDFTIANSSVHRRYGPTVDSPGLRCSVNSIGW
jgi:hypothetical protein